jgi:N-acetylneuraminic acid mutarotase
MKGGLIAIVCLLTGIVSAQNANSWVKKNDFIGFKREQAVAFSIGNKGYVGTGVDTSETVMNDFWEYDPEFDSWTQRANVPGTGRRSAIGFAVNGKGYVGTGMNVNEATFGVPMSDFYEYNPVTNIWAQKADFPGAGGFGVYYATAFTADNKGYVCGGKIAPSYYINELWEYKPSLNQWTQRSPFPGGGRYNMSSLSINDIAYVGLGTDQDAYRCDWWRYHPGTNQWTQMTDFTGGNRGGASTFTCFGKGYVCLGTNGGLKGDLFVYDPELDYWYPRADYGGSERKQAISFTIDNRAFVGLGSGVSGKKASMYEYIPEEFLTLSEEEAQVLIYPNPAVDKLIIKTTDLPKKILIRSVSGQVYYSGEHAGGLLEIPVSDLPSGTYFCEIQSERTLVHTFQIAGR